MAACSGDLATPTDPSTGTVVEAGGVVTSATRRAVGREAEFDFDSNRNDIAAGATGISATFIARQSGADVVGEILNSEGGVVASQGVVCELRYSWSRGCHPERSEGAGRRVLVKPHIPAPSPGSG
ncbi:MAG TPA: hypothetical protein VF252_08695 [Gemmatimonadales bacterium]